MNKALINFRDGFRAAPEGDVGEEVVAAVGRAGVEASAGFATTADTRDFCFFLSVPVVRPGRRVPGW